MGKGVALLGLILIIVGILPVIFQVAGLTGFEMIIDYFYILNLYTLDLGGYLFSELMLILLGLGVVLLLIGLIK